jgi:hypothetical protein
MLGACSSLSADACGGRGRQPLLLGPATIPALQSPTRTFRIRRRHPSPYDRAMPAHGPLRIVCLGSSSTQGVAASWTNCDLSRAARGDLGHCRVSGRAGRGREQGVGGETWADKSGAAGARRGRAAAEAGDLQVGTNARARGLAPGRGSRRSPRRVARSGRAGAEVALSWTPTCRCRDARGLRRGHGGAGPGGRRGGGGGRLLSAARGECGAGWPRAASRRPRSTPPDGRTWAAGYRLPSPGWLPTCSSRRRRSRGEVAAVR